MADSDHEEEHKINLVEPISRSALMNGDGVTFSISDALNRDELLEMDKPEDVFDPDQLVAQANLDVLSAPEDSSAQDAFEGLKLKMTKVNEDGTVMKRVKRHGIGDVIAPDSFVTIYYNAYMEYEEVPFDSAFLRGKPETFHLGRGFLPGLDIAISTMRVRERSEFLLHPSMAYGKYGCPPRIGPNMEVLFDVELVKAKVGVEAETELAVSREEKTSWENVHKVVKGLVSQGVELYNNGKFRDSKIKLEKAKELLTSCHMKNEEEENAQKRVLLKVVTNLAMVLNNLHDHAGNPAKAIKNCKEGLDIDPSKSKLFLQWGKALLTLGEYKQAKERLLKAKKAFPNDKEVCNTLELLEEKLQRERATEGQMWRRAFQGSNENGTKEDSKVKQDTSPEHELLVSWFEKLKNDPEQDKFTLPVGFTQKERDDIEKLAEEYGFETVMKERSYIIKKNK